MMNEIFVEEIRRAVAVKDAAIDILFMDCEMPALDGLEATRRIRELPAPQQLPVIALSAHRPEEHTALCLASGMSEYSSKPINVETLRARLSRWLWVSGIRGTGR
jgi:CheY-like chemotaxis protein